MRRQFAAFLMVASCAAIFGAPENASAASLARSGYHSRARVVSCQRHNGYLNAWNAPYCVDGPRAYPRDGLYHSYWRPAFMVPGCYYPGFIDPLSTGS